MYYLALSAAVFSDLKNIPLSAEIQEGERISGENGLRVHRWLE